VAIILPASTNPLQLVSCGESVDLFILVLLGALGHELARLLK
jgi:hypothetical protein